MSDRDEKLSALIDNALEAHEVDDFLQDLKRDPLADGERMQRYQLIRDAMRDDLSQVSMMDISAAVQRAVEQEPEFDTVAVNKPAMSWFNVSAWIKPLSGMAIAASVAMVTVVTVRTVSTDDSSVNTPVIADVGTAQNKDSSVRVATINPVIAQHVRAASTDSATQDQRNKQLNEYMMNHSGYAGQTSVQGMIPYVRVVNIEAEAKR